MTPAMNKHGDREHGRTETGLIREGTHDRAIIDFDNFSKRVQAKKAKFGV